MTVQLVNAPASHKHIVKNLLQLYIYDFSEYVNCDVEDDGLYAYPHFEDYWLNDNRFAYLVVKDEKYAGFVFVKFVAEPSRSYFSIAEFFVLKKYRRTGIGKNIAHQIFNLHRGQWEVFEMENNKPAQLFWHSVINEYTSGAFTERFENKRLIQSFEN